MLIDIVTPAFNVAPYVGDAVRSVQEQTHRYWTMTVVDDGSTDETAAVVAGFDNSRIRLLRQRNAGVSAARNLGLAATNADAVLFLDADDWLSPDALFALSETLRAAPNAVAAVGSFQHVPDGEKQGAGRVFHPTPGNLLETLMVRNLFANGGHLLIRRRVLEMAGPFHTGLSYGEDWEYWVRLAGFGGFAAVPAAEPTLFVRDRPDSAYRMNAVRPGSFNPCMDAIFGAEAVRNHFTTTELTRLRRRAAAENDWVVGRELIRHGQVAEGRRFLRHSAIAAPSAKRFALLAAASLPIGRLGPFRCYPLSRPS